MKPAEQVAETSRPNLLTNAQPAMLWGPRLQFAKRAFTTRRAEFPRLVGLLRSASPKAGDMVLASVLSVGQHTRLESLQGRRMHLYEGDEIVVAYGERYAPDQFEATIPQDLSPCDLVASGGVAAQMISRHPSIRRPTRIDPIGLLSNDVGTPINLSQFALPDRGLPTSRPRIVAVVGSSMNAGKTTTASSLIHGLTRAGLKVEAAKLTGTGSGPDVWSMLDAGARTVLDFTDMGHASTAGLGFDVVERTALSLIAHCCAKAPDIVVLELADGLLQRETSALLEVEAFRYAVDGFIFASGDALGALAGKEWLERRGHRLLGISGQLSASPLARREAERALGLRVFTKAALCDPETAPQLAFAADSAPAG